MKVGGMHTCGFSPVTSTFRDVTGDSVVADALVAVATVRPPPAPTRKERPLCNLGLARWLREWEGAVPESTGSSPASCFLRGRCSLALPGTLNTTQSRTLTAWLWPSGFLPGGTSSPTAPPALGPAALLSREPTGSGSVQGRPPGEISPVF